jgi:hypothetical protein
VRLANRAAKTVRIDHGQRVALSSVGTLLCRVAETCWIHSAMDRHSFLHSQHIYIGFFFAFLQKETLVLRSFNKI